MSEPVKETDEQKQIQRWLEGVKRYAGRKGFDISVSAKKLLEMPAAKPVEKTAAAASVHAVYGPTSMKRTTTKGGFPATVTVGTKDMGMKKTSSSIKENKMTQFEKIAVAAFNDEMQKLSGLVSEYIGTAVNPLNVIANPVAAIAALATRTRTDKEQREAAADKLSNVLVPGQGAYNLFKRLGHSAAKE